MGSVPWGFRENESPIQHKEHKYTSTEGKKKEMVRGKDKWPNVLVMP